MAVEIGVADLNEVKGNGSTSKMDCNAVTAGDWLCHMSHQSRLRDTF